MNIDRRTYLAGCILASEWFRPANIDDAKRVVDSVDKVLAELQRTCEHRYEAPPSVTCRLCGFENQEFMANMMNANQYQTQWKAK